MKLATWNVNSLKVRLPRVLEFLEAHRPDVLCLQETKCDAAAFPHMELEAAGYAAVEHSAGRWAGVAILAPAGVALEEAERGLPGETAVEEARYVEATVGDLRVASAYVPNGRAVGHAPFESKLAFFEALAARAPALGALVCGDFNVTRADIDVYDPEAFIGDTHVTPDERDRFEAHPRRRPRDAYRELHPDEVRLTWWDYRQGHFHRKMGLRIDLCCWPARRPRSSLRHRPRLQQGARSPRDHAPLLAEVTAFVALAGVDPSQPPAPRSRPCRSSGTIRSRRRPNNSTPRADVRVAQARRPAARACCSVDGSPRLRAVSPTRRSPCAPATAGSTPLYRGRLRGRPRQHRPGTAGAWRPSRRAG